MGLLDDRHPDQEKHPDFSNVQSGSSSTAPSPARQTPPPAGASTSKTYTVQKGDTLSKIAKHHYGDANEWRKIFEANQDIINDPDLIYPGQELKIPA
jgi:nucleoid-associated protein YgaU